MPQGGMASESKNCQSFSSIGKLTQTSLSAGSHLVIGIGETTATIRIPTSMSAYVIVLGDPSPSLQTEASVSVALDDNGVCWQ